MEEGDETTHVSCFPLWPTSHPTQWNTRNHARFSRSSTAPHYSQTGRSAGIGARALRCLHTLCAVWQCGTQSLVMLTPTYTRRDRDDVRVQSRFSFSAVEFLKLKDLHFTITVFANVQ